MPCEPIAADDGTVAGSQKDSEGAQVQGELALIGTDPLPVLITADVRDSAAYTAWAYMLLGFDELTCNSPEPVVREGGAEHRRFLPRDHLLSGRHRTGGESMRAERPWSAFLEPAGHWYTAGGTYVAAHISRLPFGREHSPEAAQLALQVGISLEQQETWVRDYIRGVPKDANLRHATDHHGRSWLPPGARQRPRTLADIPGKLGPSRIFTVAEGGEAPMMIARRIPSD